MAQALHPLSHMHVLSHRPRSHNSANAGWQVRRRSSWTRKIFIIIMRPYASQQQPEQSKTLPRAAHSTLDLLGSTPYTKNKQTWQIPTETRNIQEQQQNREANRNQIKNQSKYLSGVWLVDLPKIVDYPWY